MLCVMVGQDDPQLSVNTVSSQGPAVAIGTRGALIRSLDICAGQIDLKPSPRRVLCLVTGAQDAQWLERSTTWRRLTPQAVLEVPRQLSCSLRVSGTASLTRVVLPGNSGATARAHAPRQIEEPLAGHLLRLLSQQPRSALASPRVDSILRIVESIVETSREPKSDIDRVLSYIDANLDRSLSVKKLARQMGLSPSSFGRVFKQATGSTPHQFIVQARLIRARQLILSGDLPLAEIALDCGFSSQSHMTNLFRKHLGQTPGRLEGAPPH